MSTDTPTPEAVLNLPLEDNDSGADTVRGYLTQLLLRVWDEGEGFSGKRPFGNSGWHYDLITPLVRAGFVRGSFDEFGYIEDCDDLAALRLVANAIHALGEAPGG